MIAMKRLIFSIILAAMAVVPLMLCAGCSSLADSNSTDENTTVSVKETKAVPDKVELKKYEFPVFLKDPADNFWG